MSKWNNQIELTTSRQANMAKTLMSQAADITVVALVDAIDRTWCAVHPNSQPPPIRGSAATEKRA